MKNDTERSASINNRYGQRYNLAFGDDDFSQERPAGKASRSMTPYGRNLSLSKKKHKNDSKNVDRIFTDQEDLLYYPQRQHSATPKINSHHARSVDCTHPHEAYLKGIGNPKNWD